MTAPPADPYRTFITDVRPRTPNGRAPKAAVGDPVEVRAHLVRDGHGILAAQLRWRRLDGTRSKWAAVPMVVDDHGHARGCFEPEAPGMYEFEVDAWEDRFATWRRDLRVRAAAAEDLATELLDGANLLERSCRRSARAGGAAARRSSSCGRPPAARGSGGGRARRCRRGGRGRPARSGGLTTSGPHLADRLRARRLVRAVPTLRGRLRRGRPDLGPPRAHRRGRLRRAVPAPIHPIGVTNRKGPGNTLGGPRRRRQPVGDRRTRRRAHRRRPVARHARGRAALHPAPTARRQVALDHALQCSPDHPGCATTQWFQVRSDGSIRHAENPPKKYQDIHPINFWPPKDPDRAAVEGAADPRVLDRAGHPGVPRRQPAHQAARAREWVIRHIQRRHPDVVFLAEAFTDPAMMHARGDRLQPVLHVLHLAHLEVELVEYGEELAHGEPQGGSAPNLWPNTPTSLSGPLRNGSPGQFAIRAVLAATMAPSWGIYSGYELCENQPASRTTRSTCTRRSTS